MQRLNFEQSYLLKSDEHLTRAEESVIRILQSIRSNTLLVAFQFLTSPWSPTQLTMHSKHKPQKLKFHSSERWTTLRGFKGADGQRYAISDFGRAIAYFGELDFGYFLKIGLVGRYLGIVLNKNRKSSPQFIHRSVAKFYCEKPSAKHNFVIHKDFNRDNNYYQNLVWVNAEGLRQHMLKHPNYKKSRVESHGTGLKLTADRVKIIKRKLAENKTRVRILAKQFNISDTMMYRIKAGTNWGHVKI